MKKGLKSSSGFTLIELLVVIGIIGLLMGILLPAAEHVRHQAYIDKCASNLRQIGMGIAMYANENQGNYPRTTYVVGAPLVMGTGIASSDAFQPGGPSANDATASAYLLLKAEHIPTEVFICPYNDDTTYAADKADVSKQSNFTNWKINLGYSFANPYPDKIASDAGYRLTNHLSSAFAVAADRNPGIHPPGHDATQAIPGAVSKEMEEANSRNHEQDGQNVLYADGHVSFADTPLVGVGNDNIYINQAKLVNASPLNSNDSVLCPTD